MGSVLLYKIVKLNLNLRPTHPDQLGGLGFVLFAQKHFGILFVQSGRSSQASTRIRSLISALQ